MLQTTSQLRQGLSVALKRQIEIRAADRQDGSVMQWMGLMGQMDRDGDDSAQQTMNDSTRCLVILTVM